MKRIQIKHVTRYTYRQPVELGPHTLRIRPRSGHDIRIETSKLDITPAATVKWHRDLYSNSVGVAMFSKPSRTLLIRSEVVLQHFEVEPLDFVVDETAVQFPFHFDAAERVDLIPFQMPCFPNDGGIVRDWVRRFWVPGQFIETYVLLDNINKAIVQEFRYVQREEPGVQRPAETLRLMSGSCRDFATLFIEACRSFGLAARFVSGYLHCPDTVDGHGSTHAWSEVYMPGAGWKGFDSTSGIVVGPDHIATAVSRDPLGVPPLAGTYIGPVGQKPRMTVRVEVKEMQSRA